MAKVQPKRFTHAQRRTRREKMAGQVRRGKSPADVAAQHGVTLQSVRNACAEFSVALPTSGGDSKPAAKVRKSR